MVEEILGTGESEKARIDALNTFASNDSYFVTSITMATTAISSGEILFRRKRISFL